jgi:hypothetical protein
MNFNFPVKAVLVLATVSPPVVAAEVTPRMADSPEARRIRSLTLLGGASAPMPIKVGTSSSSPTERAAAKARILKEDLEALRSRITAINARLRDLPDNDPAVSRLRLERDVLLRRESELSTVLAAEARAAEAR